MTNQKRFLVEIYTSRNTTVNAEVNAVNMKGAIYAVRAWKSSPVRKYTVYGGNDSFARIENGKVTEASSLGLFV